jgi:hypothetical protein
VSQRFSARTPQGRALYDLHGRRLRPRPGTPLPTERHVAASGELLHVELPVLEVGGEPALG